MAREHYDTVIAEQLSIAVSDTNKESTIKIKCSPQDVARAKDVYGQARMLFESFGFVSGDARLSRACKVLSLPNPTTAEGIARLREIERLQEAQAEKGRRHSRPSWW